MYENHVKIAAQMVGWSDFRTNYDIDATAFGPFSSVIGYLLSVRDGSVLPSKVQEHAPQDFRDILNAMSDYDWTHDDFTEAIRDAYAFDFSHSKGTSSQKYAKLAERNARLSKSNSGNDPFELLSEEQEAVSKGEREVYPSQFHHLNGHIDGGFERGRVVTIGAFSNVGKSSLTYSLLTHALKQGKKCLFVSLEVESKVVLRFVTRCYLNKTDSQVRSEANCHMAVPRDLLRIVDDKYDFASVASAIRDFKPDFVFLDFVQNLRNGTGSEYEVMTRNASMLQELAKTENIVLFVVSQVNNDSRFKDGEAVTLKGSGALFHSSDLILTLHRDQNAGINMTIAKNKVGPAMRKFAMDVDFARVQWKCKGEITENF
jgi:predicted ATP-dependent serine protease